MTEHKRPRGDCTYCGRSMTRGGMARHLRACKKREEAIEAAGSQNGKNRTLYHLQVQDAWDGDYWMHLEMDAVASLGELDAYLRAIWLECCGHLSQFTIGEWWGDELPMSRKVARVFEPGLELRHTYDFGTSSRTLVKVVDMRQGPPVTDKPISLMARNEMPSLPCMECGAPSEWLCMECIYEYDRSGTLCDKHAGEHPHDDYGGLYPIVNSPRVGMCGYEGPADPPY